MIEPRIHSGLTGTLPVGHWMLDSPLGAVWPCSRCRYLVYRRPDPTLPADVKVGTLITWVEHGLRIGGEQPDDPIIPYVLCIFCFRAYDSSWPNMARWWFLNDDGSPQDAAHPGWADDNLTEHPYTGIDVLHDPPMELAGYARVLPDGTIPEPAAPDIPL